MDEDELDVCPNPHTHRCGACLAYVCDQPFCSNHVPLCKIVEDQRKWYKS